MLFSLAVNERSIPEVAHWSFSARHQMSPEPKGTLAIRRDGKTETWRRRALPGTAGGQKTCRLSILQVVQGAAYGHLPKRDGSTQGLGGSSAVWQGLNRCQLPLSGNVAAHTLQHSWCPGASQEKRKLQQLQNLLLCSLKGVLGGDR